MKRTALFVLLSALAFAASAQSAAPAPATPDATALSQAEAERNAAGRSEADRSEADRSEASEKADSAARPLSDRNCLRHTGSRVIRRDTKGEGCANATGRAYTREELDRTGGRDLAHSLRLLDPAIR